MVQIGDNIKNARCSKGMSQEELAHAIGSTKSTISKYELGRREPSLDTIQRISTALGVDFLDLVVLTGNQAAIDTLRKDAKEAKKEGRKVIWQNNNLLSVKMEPAERILTAILKLNVHGQQKAVERVEELTEIPKYQLQEGPVTTSECTDTAQA